MLSYATRIKALLNPAEHRQLKKLSSPQKIQDFLDSLPINFELNGETYMSVRRTLRERTAHCFEGALLGALALAYHGHKPLLLDFTTTPEDECHVVALFKVNGLWGALSKTNHSILRYRDPIYRSVRELALSYFHEYLTWGGKKSLRMYSRPFDLSTYPVESWITAEADVHFLVEAIDAVRHFPIIPNKNLKQLRKASPIELRAMKIVEWKSPKKFKRRGGN